MKNKSCGQAKQRWGHADMKVWWLWEPCKSEEPAFNALSCFVPVKTALKAGMLWQNLRGALLCFYSAPHCKRCISYGNSVRPSVRPSHAGMVSKRRHVARCSLHCQIAKCVQFCRNQKTFPRDDPFPWNLGSKWPTPPDSSESWHVLPCSASTVRASEKCSIMANRKFYTGFPTSHQSRFCAALTSSKWG